MKYTIEGFSQEAALSLKKEIKEEISGSERTQILKLDVIDLMLLRWFVDFYPKMKKKIIKETQYAWVNYQSIVEDLPLLSIEKKQVYRRFKKMCELEILTHYHDKDGGSFSYYGFGEIYASLIETPPLGPQSPTPRTSKSDPLGPQSLTKDSSIINNSSINNSFTIKEEKKEERKNQKEVYDQTETVIEKIKNIPDEPIRNKLIEIMRTRKRKNKPITHEVLKMILERLNQYSGGDREKQVEILNVSVMNGYDTVFPLNSYNKHSKGCQYSGDDSSYDIDEWDKSTSDNDYLLNAMDNLI